MTRYPRDLSGYGANPPRADWPNGAKIAVQFVINYEEGGENCLLHGDAASEAFSVGSRWRSPPGPASATGIWRAFMNMVPAPVSGVSIAFSPKWISLPRSMV